MATTFGFVAIWSLFQLFKSTVLIKNRLQYINGWPEPYAVNLHLTEHAENQFANPWSRELSSFENIYRFCNKKRMKQVLYYIAI